MSRTLGKSMRLLNELASSKVVEQLGLSSSLERILYRGSRAAVSAAVEVEKRARPMVKVLSPARMNEAAKDAQPARSDLFDLTPTDSQELVRDSMQRFARERLRPSALAADEESAPPADLLQEAHALGLSQLAVPEALGGAGEQRSPVTNALVAEELARGDMSLALAALAPVSVVHALVDFGTSGQQGEFLPVFAGDDFYPAALALLEARPLFDPQRLATRATLRDGHYQITGEKALVPLAASAELLLVFADLAGKPELFIVEKGTPGLSVEPEPAMGLRAAQLGRVRLEQVKVPHSHRVGGDEGVDGERLIDLARIAWGALSVGTCSSLLEYVKTYCNERIAFGEPISHRQSVAFAIANIAIELDAMRLMVYRAASRAEHGKSFRREASLARVQCAEKGMQIGTEGVQLLGGHGFIKEHPVELWYRQLRAVGIFEGAVLV